MTSLAAAEAQNTAATQRLLVGKRFLALRPARAGPKNSSLSYPYLAGHFTVKAAKNAACVLDKRRDAETDSRSNLTRVFSSVEQEAHEEGL